MQKEAHFVDFHAMQNNLFQKFPLTRATSLLEHHPLQISTSNSLEQILNLVFQTFKIVSVIYI